MTEKHLIMGTAGHVDHGKTSLIRALTGFDCDTHQEEKRRGITINLGFTHLALPSGLHVGVVDVPGHEDFVPTMVSGASGVDFAALVVAADDGVMPQTREHVHILEVLGVQKVVVALTKVDLVDEELTELVQEDVTLFLEETPYQGAPVVPVSAMTRTGLQDFLKALDVAAQEVKPRELGRVFRLYVDRVFSMSGFGTVVTGSVTSGTLERGQSVHLFPHVSQNIKVRHMERHGEEVDRVMAGDRASLNLAGLDREQVSRGMLVADRPLDATQRLDVELKVFEDAGAVNLWSDAMFYLGAFRDHVRVHLLDRDTCAPGQGCLAQIHLSTPCVALNEDRFVLRRSSGDLTVAGGRILDAQPLHHRRRPAELIDRLRALQGGDLLQKAQVWLAHRSLPRPLSELAVLLNEEPETLNHVVTPSDQLVLLGSSPDLFVMTKKQLDHLRGKLTSALRQHHERHPLSPLGLNPQEILAVLGDSWKQEGKSLLPVLLQAFEKQGFVEQREHSFALREHLVVITPELERAVTFARQSLESAGLQLPVWSDFVSSAAQQGISEPILAEVLHFLVQTGEVVFSEGQYLLSSVVDRSRDALIAWLNSHPDGITVADFRDLIQGNRKVCLLLLSLFDRQGLTTRDGDVRRLRP